ncbi:hypothetical protein CRUP_034312 [Coryphaenoides rupestris]|nr:hypothetical protein CRUP_034312 [Coryphaenoides rupestris]
MHQLGDEDCILPSKLQAALQQVLEERELILGQEAEQEGGSPGDHTEELSSLVSEAFVRLFVELVGHYPLHITETAAGARELQRDSFRKSHPSRGVRQFLQLFMETQMFAGFIQDKELRKGGAGSGGKVAWPGLFETRAAEYLESYPEPTGMNRFLKGLEWRNYNKRFLTTVQMQTGRLTMNPVSLRGEEENHHKYIH